jgi:hypothetical protein
MHSSTATILATPCRLAACVSDVPGISRTAGHATGQFKLLEMQGKAHYWSPLLALTSQGILPLMSW